MDDGFYRQEKLELWDRHCAAADSNIDHGVFLALAQVAELTRQARVFGEPGLGAAFGRDRKRRRQDQLRWALRGRS